MAQKRPSDGKLKGPAKKKMKMEGVAWFGSNASPPLHVLSNFHLAPIPFKRECVTDAMRAVCPEIDVWMAAGPDARAVPSSEHLWQALARAADQHTFDELTGARALRGQSE